MGISFAVGCLVTFALIMAFQFCMRKPSTSQAQNQVVEMYGSTRTLDETVDDSESKPRSLSLKQ